MKNYEKYAEEIKKLDDNASFCEQKILKPLGKSCESTDCCYCNLLKIVWLLEEYEEPKEPKEPEVDWSKVAVDTPILVRQTEDGKWIRRHFAKYEGGIVYTWKDSRTSWTEDSMTGWACGKTGGNGRRRMKYRKKPVVIEAVQWNGRNLEEIKEFVGDSLIYEISDAAWKVGKGAPAVYMEIKTLEGNHKCSKGDYIIKGVQGEFYPCKPDIFKQTYEQAGEKEWIDSQPKVGEWIPVSERLPEDDGLVLVTVNDKHNNLTFENALMTGCYYCAEGWILEGYLDWIDPNVIAWIPLPEPYKEQNNDI